MGWGDRGNGRRSTQGEARHNSKGISTGCKYNTIPRVRQEKKVIILADSNAAIAAVKKAGRLDPDTYK